MRVLTSWLSSAFAILSSVFVCDHVFANTILAFPKDTPAFTFELPDNMQAAYQADGTLVCTAKDGSPVRSVFQPLPNIHDDRSARLGLSRLLPIAAPRFLTGDVRYPALFNEDTPSGVHTITAYATGQRGGKESALALIVFAKAGKYYELMTLGSLDAMNAVNFPHSFRVTMKPTP